MPSGQGIEMESGRPRSRASYSVLRHTEARGGRKAMAAIAPEDDPPVVPEPDRFSQGARLESGIAGVKWGRLAACARPRGCPVYRRRLLQARQSGRLPIGRSLPSCPTTEPPALRTHPLGLGWGVQRLRD